ncbi:50S ribosomal protein L18 [Candidatus Hodarchaeum mangrovi]
MARNARYRVPYRRRREGKTNYHLRLRLVKSATTRAVVRVSNSHSLVQFVDAHINGDQTRCAAHTRELKKFNWSVATSNIPSAYLVGYLAGKKALKKGISNAILDIGINPPIYGSRVFAVLKGIVDAGIEIPHSDKIFPSKERLNGEHIAEYAKKIKGEDENLYKQYYSGYINQNINPVDLPKLFEKTKNQIT